MKTKNDISIGFKLVQFWYLF